MKALRVSVLLGPLVMLGCHHAPVRTSDHFFVKCVEVARDVKTKTQTFVCRAVDGHDYKVTVTP